MTKEVYIELNKVGAEFATYMEINKEMLEINYYRVETDMNFPTYCFIKYLLDAEEYYLQFHDEKVFILNV